MATLRELKGRIGSVASSEKITGAMKMISSAKMHKAEQALRQLRPFRDQVETIMANLADTDATFSSPLMEERPVQHAMIVVWGSDDGLCGAYNVNIFKGLLETLARMRQEAGPEVRVEIVPVGRKMRRAVEKIATTDPYLTLADVPEVDSKSDGDSVKAFARSFETRFLTGELDMVVLQYMHFVSAGRQRIVADNYLPVSYDNITAGASKAEGRPYLFEPDAATIFGTVLPMYLLSVMQEAFAENRASEQAARVMAMQSANDNAQKLLEQLQLEYNKLRQQGITTELLDIVGGQARD